MSDTSGEQPGSGSQINGKQQLDSWKEIAAYVHRTVATVKRWEKKDKPFSGFDSPPGRF